jgi:hypothetical protein
LRLVKGDPAAPPDFLPTAEEKPDFATEAIRSGRATPCDVAGISVWSNREAMEAMRRRVKGLRKRLVARATLTGEHGKLSQTFGEGHLTWWPSDGLPVHTLFEVIP